MSNKILVMDEEYWSIQPALDRIEATFGNDIIKYCSTGIEGLSLLKKTKFSCVVLDIMFPVGEEPKEDEEDEDYSEAINGGLIVLDEIRNKLKLSLPVICFTVRDDDDVKSAIKKYQNTTHISKINLNALDILINQIRKTL